jgi:hypothetical protein
MLRARRRQQRSQRKPADSGNEKNASITTCWKVVSASSVATMHLVDERLPRVPKTTGQDELVPEIDEEGAIDEVGDVGRAPLSQDRLIRAGPFTPVGEVHVSILARPLQMQR